MVRKIKGQKNMPAETQRKKRKGRRKREGGPSDREKREILKRRESETKKKKGTEHGQGRNWRTSEKGDKAQRRRGAPGAQAAARRLVPPHSPPVSVSRSSGLQHLPHPQRHPAVARGRVRGGLPRLQSRGTSSWEQGSCSWQQVRGRGEGDPPARARVALCVRARARCKATLPRRSWGPEPSLGSIPSSIATRWALGGVAFPPSSRGMNPAQTGVYRVIRDSRSSDSKAGGPGDGREGTWKRGKLEAEPEILRIQGGTWRKDLNAVGEEPALGAGHGGLRCIQEGQALRKFQATR